MWSYVQSLWQILLIIRFIDNKKNIKTYNKFGNSVVYNFQNHIKFNINIIL